MGLNRSRGGSKHFGNTIDQYAAKIFSNKANETIDWLILQIFGKSYNQIFSTELIQHSETKKLLETASQILETDDEPNFKVLTTIRKAIFINFEEDYSIEEWKDIEQEKQYTSLSTLVFKNKAPFYTRNKEWINKNVKDIFDYIQIDHESLQTKLLIYGITIAKFFNLLRLTPKVFRHKNNNAWKEELNSNFSEVNTETLEYCLSTTIEAILLKENYQAQHKHILENPEIKHITVCNTFLYEKASINSKKILDVKKNDVFVVSSQVPSFDDGSTFAKIIKIIKHPEIRLLEGYILLEHLLVNSI